MTEKVHLLEYNYDMPETSGIYLIRNDVNGKGYVGQAVFLPSRAILLDHEHNEPLMYAYKKYGIENFSILLLEECSREELDDREIYWIRELHTYVDDENPRGYNLTLGGHSQVSEETRRKISLSRKGKYTGVNHPLYGKHHTMFTRQKISAANTGRLCTEETKQKLRESSPHISGESHPMYGKVHTEESRRKMSESLAAYWTPERRTEKGVKCTGTANPFYGKKHSEETKDKIRSSMPDMSGEKNPFYGKHLTLEARESISRNRREGYQSGRIKKMLGEDNPATRDEVKKKLSEYNKGRIWINNGSQMKSILPEELEDYPGWTRGRLPGCTRKKQG